MNTTLLLVLLLAAPACGQPSVKEALVKHWRISGEFTIAVARAMPAESYTFRPNRAEMSFGELMAHIAALDRNACGTTHPMLPPKIVEWTKDTDKIEVDKETAILFLSESF